MTSVQEQIKSGRIILGLELGSTRIKVVFIGENHQPVAEGSYTWENQLLNGIWTYSLENVWTGVQAAYRACIEDTRTKYSTIPAAFSAIGISAMMHGYLVFDQNEHLLTPFRTWRNTITAEASEHLTKLLNYHIPQRWSVAHLYQAILNREEHVAEIDSIMTLASYVHFKLTEKKVIGIGDASGMFPIDIKTGDYDQRMIDQFQSISEVQQMPWKFRGIFPKVLKAGEYAGTLTAEGARLLDPSGTLLPGCPFCPPEGDAQTGMVATNSVKVRTGNVSAGTSDFAILVLEQELSQIYTEIDLVTSPTGALAANIHCNNCTTDLNAWVSLFREFAKGMGQPVEMDHLYQYLYQQAMQAEKNAGGILSYNYYSGEGITGLNAGRPLLVRKPDARFTLGNLMRANLYASLATLKIGMDLITNQEGMRFDRIMAHGGLFKTKEVGQKILAAALDAPVTVMENAGQGGAWGIALLADYMIHSENLSLEDWLEQKIFSDIPGSTLDPDPEDVKGFEEFMKSYRRGLTIEKEATNVF